MARMRRRWRALAKAGARVVVTVDCGTLAFEALEAAAQAGLDTIVVDHHMAEPKLPPAYARRQSEPPG